MTAASAVLFGSCASALQVTLTGDAAIHYNLTDGWLDVYVEYTAPRAVVSDIQDEFSYEVTIPLEYGEYPEIKLTHNSFGTFGFEQECDNVFDMDLYGVLGGQLVRHGCISWESFDVSGWELKVFSESAFSLTTPGPHLVLAANGVIQGVGVKGAISPDVDNPFMLYTDGQLGPLGLEAEFVGLLADLNGIENRLELYSTVLGPRLYVEYQGDTFTEFGARLGAFQFAGTLDDGDAFDQLQVEWETQLADGMDLEAQVLLGNDFHATVSAVLSF